MNREPIWHPPLTDRAREIVAAVCVAFDVSEDDVFGPSKVQLISLPRQAAWKLVRDRLHWPWEEIARVFVRERTSVTSGVQNINAKLLGNLDLARKFKNACDMLSAKELAQA